MGSGEYTQKKSVPPAKSGNRFGKLTNWICASQLPPGADCHSMRIALGGVRKTVDSTGRRQPTERSSLGPFCAALLGQYTSRWLLLSKNTWR